MYLNTEGARTEKLVDNIKLTKSCFLWSNESDGEGGSFWYFFEHFRHFIMSAAHQTLSINFLNMITNLKYFVNWNIFNYFLSTQIFSVTIFLNVNDAYLTSIYWFLLMMLPSFIRLINAYPAPLSVMVRPNASSVLTISISFLSPFLWANMKSSRPICPPNKWLMSTLCVFSVQNRICKKDKFIHGNLESLPPVKRFLFHFPRSFYNQKILNCLLSSNFKIKTCQ